MDVVALLRTLARHKVVVGVVLVATLAGMAYVLFGVPPVYRQASSVVILQPRYEPSKADLKEDKALRSVDPFNPFRGDPALILGVVSARLGNEATRAAFEAQGLDPDYQVAAALSYGAARPELEITALGSSADQTATTRAAVVEAVQRQLKAVQEEEGVAPYYMLRGFAVEPLKAPEELTSRALRSLLAVGALGAILMFAAVSLLTALDQIRAERAARAGTDRGRDEGVRGQASAEPADDGPEIWGGIEGDGDGQQAAPALDEPDGVRAQRLVPTT
jgi:hypothetical protein